LACVALEAQRRAFYASTWRRRWLARGWASWALEAQLRSHHRGAHLILAIQKLRVRFARWKGAVTSKALEWQLKLLSHYASRRARCGRAMRWWAISVVERRDRTAASQVVAERQLQRVWRLLRARLRDRGSPPARRMRRARWHAHWNQLESAWAKLSKLATPRRQASPPPSVLGARPTKRCEKKGTAQEAPVALYRSSQARQPLADLMDLLVVARHSDAPGPGDGYDLLGCREACAELFVSPSPWTAGAMPRACDSAAAASEPSGYTYF